MEISIMKSDNLSLTFFLDAFPFMSRSSSSEVFLGKGVLKKCSKFTGEQLCRSAISIKFQNNFIEIPLWHGCPLVNLLHILKIPFPKNTSGGCSCMPFTYLMS